MGYSRGNVNPTLFTKCDNKDILLVQIYIDDIIFDSIKPSLCKEFFDLMTKEFEMSLMGKLKFFLGLQIIQASEGIFINQSKYIKKLLKKYQMENLKPINTPMGTSTTLDADLEGKLVDAKQFRGMIGSLLYLTSSKLDIQFFVCLCARFQASPRESHLTAIKRIFRYLAGT